MNWLSLTGSFSSSTSASTPELRPTGSPSSAETCHDPSQRAGFAGSAAGSAGRAGGAPAASAGPTWTQ